MRKSLSNPAAAAALFIGLVVLAAPFLAAQTAKIDIPYQKFVLDNGLTLIVHEDHKAPIVAFNVWYHVGSKNEKPGKTGFAHLFEHLMFNGSENYNDDYFKPMQKVGATDLNGTTNEDRTNYFENVPVSALDLVLWMESDRMGHLKGAISQAKLDEQRGVVQNELRQCYNEPFGITEDLIVKGTYPPGHPYSWSVGGSIEDLSSGKLEDVHQWFATYYGPNNAVVAIAGDIDAKTALEKVKKYFGDIPPRRPSPGTRPGSPRGPARTAKPSRTASPSRGSTRSGTSRAGAPTAPTSSISPAPSSPTARPPASTSAWSMTTRSPRRSAPTSTLREIGGQFTDPGRRQARRRAGPGGEGHRRGAGQVPRRRPDRGRAANGSRPSPRPASSGASSGSAASAASPTSWRRARSSAAAPDAYKNDAQAYRGGHARRRVKESAGHWLSDGVYILEVHPYPQLAAAEERRRPQEHARRRSRARRSSSPPSSGRSSRTA